VRLYRQTKTLRLDFFTSTLVQINRAGFNRFTRDVLLHGFHAQAKSWIPRTTVEAYHFFKVAPREASELNRIARTAHHSTGFRTDGKLPLRFDYMTETVVQYGILGGETHRAWAGAYQLGYTLFEKNRYTPRVFSIYSYGSGDKNFGDGRRGTFDHLYPTNHSHFGIADRVGWRNMQEAEAGLIWRPAPKLVLRHEYHSIWLATRKDAFYLENGRPLIRNPLATTNHLYQEVSVDATWEPAKQVQIRAGYAHIFPGGFLRQSGRAFGATFPYLQWRYTF